MHTSAAQTLTAPPGSVVILKPRVSDAELLNQERPRFALRELRVVLWCDRRRSVALARRAPDFYDWISHCVACPSGPPPHAIAGLRRAADAPGIVWRGSGVQAALRAAFPGATVRRIRSARRVLRILQGQDHLPDADHVVITGLDRPYLVRRAEWALEDEGRQRGAVLVDPAVRPDGFRLVDGRVLALERGAEDLARAGAAGRVAARSEVGEAGLMAALVGLEPDAIAVVAALLRGGADPGALAAGLAAAPDPGVWAVRCAEAVDLKEESEGRPLDETTIGHRAAPADEAAAREAHVDPEALLHEVLERRAQAKDDPSALAPLRGQLVRAFRDEATSGELRAELALQIAAFYETRGELELTYRFCRDGLRLTRTPARVHLLARDAASAALALGWYDRAIRMGGRAWRAAGASEGLTEWELATASHPLALALFQVEQGAAAPGVVAFGHSQGLATPPSSPLERKGEELARALADVSLERYDQHREDSTPGDMRVLEAGALAADTLVNAGQLRDARRVVQDLENRWRVSQELDHPNYADFLHASGRLLAAEGDSAEALALFERGRVLVCDRLGGPPHRLAELDRDRARALEALGRMEDARVALAGALEEKRRVTGSGSVGVAMLEVELANLLEKHAQWDAAIDQYANALHTAERCGSIGLPRFVDASRARQALLRRQGRLEEALVESDRALDAAEHLRNASPALRAVILAERGEALRAMGRYASAREAYEAALPILRALGEVRGSEVASVLVALGAAWLAEGEPEKAEAALDEAITLFEQSAEAGGPGLEMARRLIGRAIDPSGQSPGD